MRKLVRNYSAGMVATIDRNGFPAVSPKATFVVVDEKTLAFGNIRSPGTIANLKRHPGLEVCFLDVLARKAVRVAGSAEIIPKTEVPAALHERFRTEWPDYLGRMSAFVVITVERAELVLSPAYDIGLSEAALRRTNLEKINRI
ncbi:MAG: pyridoxamine 5'-phosphate oxidase family protein [Rhodobacteraceae bacterium]|nr:pyridoxamine 5'-phosphate oxidase family protein [Paracoccaceae bacterium]